MYSSPGIRSEMLLLLLGSLLIVGSHGCENDGIDLVFVVDGSGSVGSFRFQLIREFTENISATLISGQQESSVGAIVFSSSSSIHFHLRQYTNATTLLPALNPGLPYPGGGTNIAAALQFLLSSTQDGTMGIRDGRSQIAVVLTDGQSNDRPATLAAAAALHAANIYQVYAVGLGRADLVEVNAIASDPSLVFFRREFDADTVAELTENFTRIICRTQSASGESGDDDDELSRGAVAAISVVATFAATLVITVLISVIITKRYYKSEGTSKDNDKPLIKKETGNPGDGTTGTSNSN